MRLLDIELSFYKVFAVDSIPIYRKHFNYFTYKIFFFCNKIIHRNVLPMNNQNKHNFHMDINLQNKLFRIALRIVNNKPEAEDVVQEVLIKIWKKKEQLESIANKNGYYMMMARNQALDSLRKRKIKTTNIEDQFNLKDGQASPSQALESKDKMKSIISLINNLPEKQKTVLHLRDVEGYSYKEIAEISTMTVDQVKVNLHRARITMREQILASGLR